MRDGSARGCRPVLRRPGHEGLRRRLGTDAPCDRAHGLPPGLARGLSPAAERSSRRSSRSAVSGRGSIRRSSGSSRLPSPTGERHLRTPSPSRVVPPATRLQPRSRRSDATPACARSSSTPPSSWRCSRRSDDQRRARRRRSTSRSSSGRPVMTGFTRSQRSSRGSSSTTRSRSSPPPSSTVARLRGRFARPASTRGGGRSRCRSSRGGVPGSRSGSPSPLDSAAGARMPRRRSGSRTTSSTSRCPRGRSGRSREVSASTSPSSSNRAPARAWRRHAAPPGRAAPGLQRVAAPARATWRRPRPARSTVASRVREGLTKASRRHRDRGCREPSRSGRAPRQRSRPSSLAARLRELGAFRADVSGAGPVLYALFRERAAAEAPRPPSSPSERPG